MKSLLCRWQLWLAIVIFYSLLGCNQGIRNLQQAEYQYFVALKDELAYSRGKVKGILDSVQVNKENALREIARFDNKIRTAKLISSVQEFRKQNKKTRDETILYYLVEANKASALALAAEFDVAKERRKQILKDFNEIEAIVKRIVEGEKLLHQHFNKGISGRLSDLLSETRRQVEAFNKKIEQSDQENAAIKKLTEAGKKASKRIEQAEKGLAKVIELWQKLP